MLLVSEATGQLLGGGAGFSWVFGSKRVPVVRSSPGDHRDRSQDGPETRQKSPMLEQLDKMAWICLQQVRSSLIQCNPTVSAVCTVASLHCWATARPAGGVGLCFCVTAGWQVQDRVSVWPRCEHLESDPGDEGSLSGSVSF